MPDNWARYQRHPSLVLGFHGTEKIVVNRVVNRQDPHLKASDDRYEWLGHSIYFWENDPQHGLEWAASGKLDAICGICNRNTD